MSSQIEQAVQRMSRVFLPELVKSYDTETQNRNLINLRTEKDMALQPVTNNLSQGLEPVWNYCFIMCFLCSCSSVFKRVGVQHEIVWRRSASVPSENSRF